MNAAARKQYFTLAEANRRLPLVRVIVQDIVHLFRDVQERRERLARLRHGQSKAARNEPTPHSEETQQMQAQLEQDIEQLQSYVEELEELGAELKDPARGLVDFLTRIDGREAYLCWQLGEDDIAWWHDLNAGFAGRQSLMEGSIPGHGAGQENN